MTIFLARTVRSPTLTVSAPSKLAWPFSHSTLFFLNRNSMPPVRPFTASSRWACMASRSSSGVTLMPILAIAPSRGSLEIFGGVKHRLGRDAADVEAGAAERLAALRAGGLQPELRGADRGDIAAGAGADHQDVEIVISHCLLSGRNASGRDISGRTRANPARRPLPATCELRAQPPSATGNAPARHALFSLRLADYGDMRRDL